MNEPKEPSGPTKIKGQQGMRKAAQEEEALIDSLAEPSEPAPEAKAPHDEGQSGAGEGDKP